ncbi:MAG: M48 family metallopeptidase [Chloroflexota bacterium]
MASSAGRDPLPAWSVRRSERARRARLTVEADGSVVVVLPRRAPASTADALVAAHTGWIAERRVRLAAERSRLATRPALNAGRVLLVHGIPHRVVRDADADGRVRTRVRHAYASDAEGIVGELRVALPADADLRPPVEAWLRGTARTVLVQRVAERSGAIGVRPGPITIRGQRSRWGSASARGALSFNWRLVLAPPFVLDAVVVHELAHLVVRGHSARFWALARAHAPRTDEARAWLRAHHADLFAALD